jgi:ABC-type multidrug transport system fused ATPase/permease subunit
VDSWLDYLKRGLSRPQPEDQLKEPGGQAGIKANLENLRPYLSRHWRKGVLGAALVLFGTLLTFPIPLIYRYLIDDVILTRQLQRLVVVVSLLAGIKILSMASGALQQYYFARFEQAVVLDIQSDLFERTLRLPKAFFDKEQTGYLMSRLSSDIQGLRWFFSSILVDVFSNALRLLGGVVFLFYLEWRLALVTLIVIPGIVLSVRYYSAKLRTLSLHSMEQQANISRQMQESLSASTLIKAFSSEERTAGRIRGEWQTARSLTLEQTTVGSLANFSIGIMPEVTRGIVLVVGAFLVILGQWTLGSLLAFQSYLGYVFGPIQFLASANLQLQYALAALERVSVLFDTIPEENLGCGETVNHLHGDVYFEKVSFAYNPQEPVLEDITFRVNSGDHIAIVGPSGVVKTTLISLILRFYKPTQGEILFDGRSASEYEVGSLRRRIGYVSQGILLLSGTLRDNLCYGNPDASDEQIIRATRASGIHDFIASLPHGYDSPVGEHGVNLSKGQNQRLSIARALITEPDILVMDEPTSALDSIMEKTIFDALPTWVQGKTLFVVAHHLTTVQNADRILLLNEKRLVAMGTHRELLENSDYYRCMVAGHQITPPEVGN